MAINTRKIVEDLRTSAVSACALSPYSEVRMNSSEVNGYAA